MSAIAALYHLDGRPAEPSTLENMLRPLQRRGPHGHDVWTGGPVGLGHARLHSIPESLHEIQPLLDRNLTISADLRLDNRTELLAELGGDSTVGDAGLILKAYRKWGSDCPSRLLGDFAFFIWDADARTGFGARDHMGVKPFYYYRQAGRLFACASDPAALLAIPEIPRTVNESRIADYLVPILEGSDKTSTFFRDIFRLPPAHSLTVTPDAIRIAPYWTVDASAELRLSSEEEYAEAFREIFTAAVACRMRSAGTVGVMLSGGLDSCAVAGVARKTPANPAGLRTYSCLRRDSAQCPETLYVKAMLETGGLAPQFIYDDQVSEYGALLDEHFATADDLFDFADIPLIAYHAAERDGVHVMLDGVDGDVVAAANALYLIEFSRQGEYGRFLSSLPQYAKYYGFTRLQQAALLWNQGIKPFVKDRLPVTINARRAARTSGDSRIDWNGAFLQDSLIDHDFAERIGLAEKLLTITGDTQWGQRGFRENDALTLNAPIIMAAIERYDRLAASRSIEARHPFFDKRVVEFCLSLPLEIKQADGWAKAIVRRATAGTVPDLVRWRRHSASNLNFHFFAETIRPSAEHKRETLQSGLKEIAPYVNHATLSDCLAGKSAVASQPASLWKLYQALRLLTWLRRK
jgi:asparagine synthase (glutamine-hydrolysing)